MFKKVDPKQDFIKLEHDVIKFWQENKIIDKYLTKNEKSEKRWSFLDGPITANNPMGVHHAWGRTLKDLWQRFYAMNGYRQRYQNGFDCQGLWVEVEVEKELGFKTKKDIEEYGIDKFVNKCKERVLKYSGIQTEQSKRLAEWMDWNNSYYTMSEENNYTIWHFLKVCAKNGWIYQGTDSVPWCPRCGTAISQHEMLTEEYKEVTHDSIFFTLPIIGDKFKNTYLLVWTTTPWTIPANVAVAADPNKDYTIVGVDEKKFILLSSRAKKIFPKIKGKEISGKELIGLKYNAPFAQISGIKKAIGEYEYQVVASDEMILPVTEEEGTGLVHIAPGAGSEDFKLGQKYKLPVVNVIDESANYLDYMDEFSKKNAKNNPELIFDYLQNKEDGKYFYKIEKYKHRYPTCWRCKTELVWRNVKEWYIAMDRVPKSKIKSQKSNTFRERMIEVARKINWNPTWGKDRELDWLKNMHDWLISKKRYWGLALPIWQCEHCGEFEVIGSKDELKEKATSGYEKFDGHTPHKPWIDEVKIKCPKCQKEMSRIADVGNPWLDAGIVPFSTLIDPKTKQVSYLTDKKYWKEWFPVDFITECFPGQFKNWFYALIAMSTALEDTNPYKTLLGHALVRDEHGREMHKSTGNAIWFEDAAEKMGVDVMRLMYVKQNPVQNLNFGYTPANEILRRFVLILWNTYSFFTTYASVDKWKPKNNEINFKDVKILDRWIISKMNILLDEITLDLKQYNAYRYIEKVEKFIDLLSTWYLRRSRKRRDDAFYSTMYYILITIVKIISPVMPHISESMYQNLKTDNDPESVHLTFWPISSEKMIDRKLSEKMDNVRDIVEMAHSLRKENSLKVRQPLAKLIIDRANINDTDLLQIIAEEINVKNVNENEKPGEAFKEKKNDKIEIYLDIELTNELKMEGIAREFVRTIQFMRKDKKFTPNDKIEIYFTAMDEFTTSAIMEYSKMISTETLATSIENGFIGKIEPQLEKNNIKLAIKLV